MPAVAAFGAALTAGHLWLQNPRKSKSEFFQRAFLARGLTPALSGLFQKQDKLLLAGHAQQVPADHSCGGDVGFFPLISWIRIQTFTVQYTWMSIPLTLAQQMAGTQKLLEGSQKTVPPCSG